MRSIVAILLLVVMASLASGYPQALHEREHELEQAVRPPGNTHNQVPVQAPKSPEKNCRICVAFHAPIMSVDQTAWLMDTGIWVRYVSMLAISQQSQTFPTRLSCRGPPIAFSC